MANSPGRLTPQNEGANEKDNSVKPFLVLTLSQAPCKRNVVGEKFTKNGFTTPPPPPTALQPPPRVGTYVHGLLLRDGHGPGERRKDAKGNYGLVYHQICLPFDASASGTAARDGVKGLHSACRPGACNRHGLRRFGALSWQEEGRVSASRDSIPSPQNPRGYVMSKPLAASNLHVLVHRNSFCATAGS